jgi:hypothetical protein
MSAIWIPETIPPQVTPLAEEALLGRVLEQGIDNITGEGLDVLRSEHVPLAEYLDRLGFTLNGLSTEGFWPDKVLKTAASVSILAYRETGYFQTVDEDIFNAGASIAATTGVPDAYTISCVLDSNLQNLLDTIQETPELIEVAADRRHQGGYQQVVSIGGGCVRHYLQQALAA